MCEGLEDVMVDMTESLVFHGGQSPGVSGVMLEIKKWQFLWMSLSPSFGEKEDNENKRL